MVEVVKGLADLGNRRNFTLVLFNYKFVRHPNEGVQKVGGYMDLDLKEQREMGT